MKNFFKSKPNWAYVLIALFSLGFSSMALAQNICTSSAISTSYNYIDEVNFAGINNSSGDNGGYADFTNLTAAVIPGSTYMIELNPENNFPFSNRKNKWRVWIDYNGDGDFDDSGERVLSAKGKGTLYRNIQIPNTFNGAVTMRVSMSLFGYPPSCGTFNYGEVEDYTISTSACPANAGSLTADSNPVGLMGGSANIAATQNINPLIPPGYSSIYVLTSGTGLVIEQVNSTPSFTVNSSGIYTIHTLVYDPNTLDLSTVVFGTTTGFDVNSLLIQGGGSICASLDVTGAPINVCMVDAGMVTSNLGDTLNICAGDGFADPFTMSNNGMSSCNYAYVITSPTTEILGISLDGNLDFDGAGQGECWVWGLSYTGNVLAGVGDVVASFGPLTDGTFDLSSNYVVVQRNAPDAGSLTASSTSACIVNGSATIDATSDGNMFVPPGYSSIYVLTSGTGLVIEQVNATPNFTVNNAGLYTIHTLVYDASTLDLSTVVFGTTTGFDVNGLLTQGGGSICGSLDVAGAPINVAHPDAGTITANADTVCGATGITTISATADGNSNVPAGFNTVYVLTSGVGLVIEQAGANPSFDVTTGGNYTIHTLVYDPNTLDLTTIVFGTTTGFDVNSLLVQGGGSICASLDVAGAPIYVESPDAGTLTATLSSTCFINGSAVIDATADGNMFIPSGYTSIYVLTSGTGLVIEQVNATPDFTVNNPGLYTIHSLVYNPNTLDLSTVVFGTTTGFDVNSLLTQGGGSICASLDVAGAPIIVAQPDAGTITANADTLCGSNGIATISATPDGNNNVPTGFSIVYVLTSGTGLVIEQAGANPSFEVTNGGNYTIHTLVYDPNTLDLTTIVFGTTTGFDVNSLLVQGGGTICASLDVAGASIYVENPFAGNIYSDNFLSCIDNGSSTLSATPAGDVMIPAGYSVVYVLTEGSGLTIEQAGANPSFNVTSPGVYRIHTLVYDTNTLDLGIVVPGTTTGFDVNSLLVQGGGNICASLDVGGAPFLVFPSWLCKFFNDDRVNISYYMSMEPEQAYSEIVNVYEYSKNSIGENIKSNLYPNPAIDNVTIELNSSEERIESVIIYNSNGQKVYENSYTGFPSNTIEVNVTELKSGLYYVQLVSNDGIEVLKLEVQ